MHDRKEPSTAARLRITARQASSRRKKTSRVAGFILPLRAAGARLASSGQAIRPSALTSP
jgi:hypothetical protein